ncbi:MAG: amidase family protein, partial [Ilumatobacteraceae bacterium]
QELCDDLAGFMEPWDIWLTPTVGAPPPPLGSFRATAEDPTRGMRTSASFLPFTSFINVTGQPAMSVPLLWNADDVPIGTHFVGRYGDESTLFRLAGQLEEARPWARRVPKTALFDGQASA